MLKTLKRVQGLFYFKASVRALFLLETQGRDPEQQQRRKMLMVKQLLFYEEDGLLNAIICVYVAAYPTRRKFTT